MPVPYPYRGWAGTQVVTETTAQARFALTEGEQALLRAFFEAAEIGDLPLPALLLVEDRMQIQPVYRWVPSVACPVCFKLGSRSLVLVGCTYCTRIRTLFDYKASATYLFEPSSGLSSSPGSPCRHCKERSNRLVGGFCRDCLAETPVSRQHGDQPPQH